MSHLPLFEERLEREFRAFHEANPSVYIALRDRAFELLKAGRKRYGIMALINVVRWHRALTTHGDDYKINNNFAPFYARLLMEQEPDLAGFFEVRTSVADEHAA